MSIEIENRRTVERMWKEAAVQDDLAAKATAQVETLAEAERTAAAQVAKAEAQLREAQQALITVRTDLATSKADLADASTERDDLRTIVRAVCADMGWPLPGADSGGQDRTPADQPGPARTDTARLVANGDRNTKASPAVEASPADAFVAALINSPAGPQLPPGVAPIDPRSAEVTRTDGASE